MVSPPRPVEHDLRAAHWFSPVAALNSTVPPPDNRRDGTDFRVAALAGRETGN
jgi:hypothetical protein